MHTSLPRAVRVIVECFSVRPEVVAIALGGSRAARSADLHSDYDIYVFVDGDIPHDVRREVAKRFDPAPEIGNTWFGEGDEWADWHTETSIDLMFWEQHGFETQLRDVIERHRPSLGYSTSFWYTVRQSTSLFDRDGWFARLHELAEIPYPDELRRAIVAWNHPLLRSSRSSYRHQVELAIERDDPVSIQHRITELLASAFDIVFALNRALHPGEKRLLVHLAGLGDGVSGEFDRRVRELLLAASSPFGGALLRAIDALCDEIDNLIRADPL
jgi:predicted nucleotidyltransferase